jgi:mRNA-degrading endonuclease RelE of RelBE toxin-antitoxin system
LEPAIDGLGTNPHPTGSVKLAGLDDFRIRVGDYRIVYAGTMAKISSLSPGSL